MKLPLVKIAPATIDLTGLSKRFMNPGELEVLTTLVRSVNPIRMVEIGVNEGRTAKVMLDNVPTLESYLGIDVPKGYVTSKKVQRREVPENPGHYAEDDHRFNLMVRPRGSLEIDALQIGSCDVMFIDGDHGFAGVTNDTRLARKCVRPGGLIIWHDYHDIETVDVRLVLDDLYEQGHPIKHAEGTWLAFEYAGSEQLTFDHLTAVG